MAAPGQILAALAALAPDSQPVVELKVPADDMARLPLTFLKTFHAVVSPGDSDTSQTVSVDPDEIAPLIKRARLRDEGALRIGWLWVHGVAPDRAR